MVRPRTRGAAHHALGVPQCGIAPAQTCRAGAAAITPPPQCIPAGRHTPYWCTFEHLMETAGTHHSSGANVCEPRASAWRCAPAAHAHGRHVRVWLRLPRHCAWPRPRSMRAMTRARGVSAVVPGPRPGKELLPARPPQCTWWTSVVLPEASSCAAQLGVGKHLPRLAWRSSTPHTSARIIGKP